ncbi:MAG: Uma2 family endonuclease [Cyclobacteriaceae bacterium]
MQTKIDRTKVWTLEDYLMLGEINTPCQLINGELIMSPSPTPLHQRVSRKLFNLLEKYGNNTGEVFYAPMDLYIDKQNVFQPDLIYISKAKSNIITQRAIEGVPDLIVEIISPSNIFTDRNTKKKVYQKIGVKEYWIVDPANQTLEIYLDNQADPEVPHLYLVGDGKVS